MSTKFPERIELGEGFPWAMGVGPDYTSVALGLSNMGFSPVVLNFPRELWARELPKYRLVLEKIE